MTSYEQLLDFAANEGINIVDFDLGANTKGLYCDGYIFINKHSTGAEKYCTLAEELGHHYTASTNIVTLDTTDKRKQEQLGRRWGYEKILPLEKIIDTIIAGNDTLSLAAEQLEVTPEYLQEALTYYGQKYGPHINYKNYNITISDTSLIVQSTLEKNL